MVRRICGLERRAAAAGYACVRIDVPEIQELSQTSQGEVGNSQNRDAYQEQITQPPRGRLRVQPEVDHGSNDLLSIGERHDV
jgi:hypothetical protein